MSLRLHAVSGTTEIDLIPTPSHITYMIFVDHRGSLHRELIGQNAKRALYMYLEWVDSLDNSIYTEWMMTFYKEIYTNIHRQHIEEFIKRDDRLVVYMM